MVFGLYANSGVGNIKFEDSIFEVTAKFNFACISKFHRIPDEVG